MFFETQTQCVLSISSYLLRLLISM